MKLSIITTVAALALSSGAAFAKDKGNSDLARAMSDATSSGLATIGGTVTPDKGNNGKGTASDISGGGNGGWGNIGSSAVSGGQVSNRGGNRGN